jgi:probable HAF family extracellular repeat protein
LASFPRWRHALLLIALLTSRPAMAYEFSDDEVVFSPGVSQAGGGSFYLNGILGIPNSHGAGFALLIPKQPGQTVTFQQFSARFNFRVFGNTGPNPFSFSYGNQVTPGLQVLFDAYPPAQGPSTISVSWKGEELARITNGYVAFPARAFSMHYEPTTGLSVSMVDYHGNTIPILDRKSIVWDPAPGSRFRFDSPNTGGDLNTLIKDLNVSVIPTPYLESSLPARSTFQDQPFNIPVSASVWDPLTDNLQFSIGSEPPSLLSANGVTLSYANPTNVTFTVQPSRGAYGTARITVLAGYGGGLPLVPIGQYQHTILSNVPPTLSIAGALSVPQGATQILPFSIGSQNWPLNSLDIAIVSYPTQLVAAGSLHILPVDGAPSQRNLILTPALDQTGTGTLVVRVTDGSGDSVTNTVQLTTTSSTTPPTVLGAGSSLSFNEYSGFRQYAVDPNPTEFTLGSTATFEAWVRPTQLPDDRLNFVVHAGIPSPRQAMVLALQKDGSPSLSNWENDAVPTNATRKVTLNQWHHLAAVVSGQAVTFYVDGQVSATAVLPSMPAIGAGQIYLAHEPIETRIDRPFIGQLDEVRIWSTARSAAEIKESMNLRVRPDSPGLRRDFRFDEGFLHFDGGPGGTPSARTYLGARAIDSSASQRPIVLVAFPTYLPGVGLQTSVNVEEDVSSPIGLGAMVRGTNAWGSGSVVREVFFGPAGTLLTNGLLASPGFPSRPDVVTASGLSIEVPPGGPSLYGQRIRGLLLAPESGTYAFAIASAHEGQLWLSTDDSPANLQRIATSPASGIPFRRFDVSPSQQVGTVTLQAGRRYAFEVRHQAGDSAAGNPHLSVQWTLPSGTVESPIPAYRVLPFGSPPASDPLTLQIALKPDWGSLQLNQSLASYQPKPNYFGADDFIFEGNNTDGAASPPVRVLLNVLNRNDAPVAGSGYALRLDGKGGNLATPNQFNLGGGSFTVELWARRNTTNPPPTADHIQPLWVIFPDLIGSGSDAFLGWFSDGSIRFAMGNPPNTDDLKSQDSFLDTNWHHWAAVFDASSGRRELFRDGSSVGFVTDTNSSPQLGLLFLGSLLGFGDYFDGDMDEFRIWARSRSRDEIRSDMNRPLAGNENDLLIYYRLDEGNGLVAYDTSSPKVGTPHFDAIITNTVTWISGIDRFSTNVVPRNSPGQAIFLPGLDPDREPISYQITGQPAHGELTPDPAIPGRYIYVPHALYHGNDSFRYTVQAGNRTSSEATVHITIDNIPIPPTIGALRDQELEEEDPALVLPLQLTDTDRPDGSRLTLTARSSNPTLLPPSQILFSGTGTARSVTLEPVDGEVGTATIELEVSNGAQSASTTFVVRVNPRLAFAIVNVGALTSQASSFATALNDAGHLAGYMAGINDPTNSQPFFYKGFGSDAKVYPIPTFGGSTGAALGVNGSGLVVGASVDGLGALGGFSVDPTLDEPLIPLGNLAGGSLSVATAVNDDGLIVGYALTTDGSYRAVSGGLNPLTALPLTNGFASMWATAVNRIGEIAGHARVDPSGATNAFLHVLDQTRDLGRPAGADHVIVSGLNAGGDVVGHALYPSGASSRIALYRDGRWTDLGDMLGGGAAQAGGINRFGQIVGRALTTNGTWHAFLYTDGRAFDLNTLQRASTNWTLTDARAINDRAQIATTGNTPDGHPQALLLFPATEIGRRVFRPEGTLAELPHIQILQGRGDDQANNAFIWNTVERKLYAIRPVVALIEWRTGTTQIFTNDTLFGEALIRQRYTNEVVLPTLSFNVWPIDPQIHVVDTPVQLQPDVPSFRHSLVDLSYTTADGAKVDGATKVFTSPSTGYSVLRYLKSDGRTPNPELQPYHFTVARSVTWNDTNYVTLNVPATVGSPLTHPLHNDYPGLNGFVFFPNAYYDGTGADAAHDRPSRRGPILPVNSNERGEDFAVVWYSQDAIGTAWSSIPVAYDLQWPTNAPVIVIASGRGSGLLPATALNGLQIYNQPNTNLPGFNPNEEHALIRRETVFALRDDLNARIQPQASQPFVLAKYIDPASSEWRMLTYRVVAEQAPYFFRFDGIAGNEIQPPPPILDLPIQVDHNRMVSGPAWKSVHGSVYARAASIDGGEDDVVIQYFYPLQADFFFDLNQDGKSDASVGSAIPWLDRSPTGTLGVPVNVTYAIQWPPETPALHIGSSLTQARDNLPDVRDMASVQVVFDSLDPQGARPANAAARLYDPLSPRTIVLDEGFEFPNAIARSLDPTTGTEAFADLPYVLRVRLFHDPRNRLLGFQGWQQPTSPGANPVTLVNVMSSRERDTILALDTSASPAFREAVENLYRKTRNPNRVDLDSDGIPDEGLLIGLTMQITTNNGVVITNVVRETLLGPKALTAGQPVPPIQAKREFAIQFPDANSAMFVGAVYSNVVGNFTTEFWVRPESNRPTTTESDSGSEGTTGQPFAIYPLQGATTYGANQASLGVSVGTNGVSVFQHTDNVLSSLLVLTTNLTGWHHVAVAVDRGQPVLYIDGVLARVGIASSFQLHPSADLVGSKTGSGNYGHFSGAITDVRIWNHTRTQGAIAFNLDKRLGGKESGLVGLWRFEEGTGTTITDASPSQATGTLSGNPTWSQQTPPAAPVSRYVVLAENNDSSLAGLPIDLHVLRVEDQLDAGALAIIQPDNVLDERVTLRHTADFAGQPESFVFHWYYRLAEGNQDPTDLPRVLADGSIAELEGWSPYETDPVNGSGVNDLTLGQGPQSSLLTLSDTWFVLRYGIVAPDGTTRWSGWIGDPSSTPDAPRAMLVPGWINRVLHALNLFSQRSSDFSNNAVNTLGSTIAEAGPRYEGDVALNPSQLDNFGLIEIYGTVLRRGRNLSIDGTPALEDPSADSALQFAAASIADLYLLHANEAFADAADPTIGLTTDSTELGSVASSVFAFENQVDSLLEEELAMLRGRDNRQAGVGAAPVYNRLFWNFTGGEGEVAYVAKYGVPDQDGDGFINAADARILFPQGHGDAWGHYLTALTSYYDLLRHPHFEWEPRPEETLVAGVPIQVNYQDERRFARAAAARARTGAEILDRTYRLNHSEDPVAQLQGYRDTDPTRAWGVPEWSRRAAVGAYFDWVVGNAILPPVDPDPTHTGIQKIDRTTVVELGQIVAESSAIQSVLDIADSGYNPLGFARGVVAFDMDPEQLNTGFSRVTHFEQIYQRAIQALLNAETTFNRATILSSELRKQQNSVSDFSVAVANQELAYRNQLIGFFGYPYAGDVGPGGAYPSGYVGPDIAHWMYLDTLSLTPQNNPRSSQFTGLSTNFSLLTTTWSAEFSSETTSTLDPSKPAEVIEIEYPVATSDYGFIAPTAWGTRPAEGSLQTAFRNLVNANAQLLSASTTYANLVTEIEEQADLLSQRYELSRDMMKIRQDSDAALTGLEAVIGVSKGIVIANKTVSEAIKAAEDGIFEAIPKVLGFSNDFLAPARALAGLAGFFAGRVATVLAAVAEELATATELSKDGFERRLEIALDSREGTFERTEQIKELEGLVRAEATLRFDVFQARQSVLQAARSLEATLAEGQRLLAERTVFRQQTAGTIQAGRYRDLALRVFRNDALQKYDAQFELAARYVHLAATAYDYELNLDGPSSARSLLPDIVRERNLGELSDGQPVVGRVGLASILGRLRQNFDVLKGQLGINNDRAERSRFSLRTEAFRILPAGTNASANTSWRSLLQQSSVNNLWDFPEFRRHCRSFAQESDGPQPGIILRFSTAIEPGRNFFSQPLGPLDSGYDPSEFATRIRSVAVWFSDYDTSQLASKPRVYLIPLGTDRLRAQDADDFTIRDWQVLEQRIPVPFPIGSTASLNPIGFSDASAFDGGFAEVRRHSAFRAYQDAAFDSSEFNESSRLIGRSVWNSQWVLIIPGSYLLGDPQEGVKRLIQSVSDIKLYFQTYSISGN